MFSQYFVWRHEYIHKGLANLACLLLIPVSALDSSIFGLLAQWKPISHHNLDFWHTLKGKQLELMTFTWFPYDNISPHNHLKMKGSADGHKKN